MTATDLVAGLRACGVHLEVVGGRLRYFGPVGAVPAELRKQLAEQHTEIVAVLMHGREETRPGVGPAMVSDPAGHAHPRGRHASDAEAQPGDVCCAAVEREGSSWSA